MIIQIKLVAVAVVVEGTAKGGNRQQTISYLAERENMEDGMSHKMHSNHNGFRT